ncbi:MAG: DUF1631 family protein [Rubrivivax sp.]
MVTGAAPTNLAGQVRRLYTDLIANGLPAVVSATMDGANALREQPAEPMIAARRRDAAGSVARLGGAWHRGIVAGLRNALNFGVSASRIGEPQSPSTATMHTMSLVDDDTIELEIMTSRLALAIMDRASWQFSDLRARIAHLERRAELDPHDLMRAHVLARVAVDAWRACGLTQNDWRELQSTLHDEFAHLVEEAYHEANRWLIERQVLPEVDLRSFIKRQRSAPMAHSGYRQTGVDGGGSSFGNDGPASRPNSVPPRGYVGDETRMMTRSGGAPRGVEHVEAVLGRLNRLVGRHVPNFLGPPRPVSPGLAQAIQTAQAGLTQRLVTTTQQGEVQVTTPVMLDEVRQRNQALKRAAATPEERATIEIVALLFQSILTEDRIPARIRVWFARLQMPVLRVAVGEPDFFATVDHPARRLIDRMGACVMGFDTAGSSEAGAGEPLEREIKRVVQVVEAYPDTGRRVFQSVLSEFEKFLDHWFKNENEATKRGVSLAQQVEQRETLAIQYTIEMRRMLNEVPVQDGVRQFLFQVWADVLATSAVRHGAASDATKLMKRAAADLIWSASAKVTREERTEVIRRLPLLLKALRDGMSAAGLDAARQDEHIRQLNDALAAAFTAKAAVIPPERLQSLMERLETLEELLPEADDVSIDESMVLDLSGHESAELAVVDEGGSMPTQAMLAWARELQVGSWYMLEFRGRTEPVQLAWQGLRRQLSLFVGASGRCVLFQQQRLASFLQAGLLLPAQDEALTVRATRSALAKLDVDASVLND